MASFVVLLLLLGLVGFASRPRGVRPAVEPAWSPDEPLPSHVPRCTAPGRKRRHRESVRIPKPSSRRRWSRKQRRA